METAIDTIRSTIRKMEIDLDKLREAEKALSAVASVPNQVVQTPLQQENVETTLQKTGGFSCWNSVREDFVNNNVTWEILQAQHRAQARGINELRRQWFEEVTPRLNVSSFRKLPDSVKKEWYERSGLTPFLAQRSYTVPIVHNIA